MKVIVFEFILSVGVSFALVEVDRWPRRCAVTLVFPKGEFREEKAILAI